MLYTQYGWLQTRSLIDKMTYKVRIEVGKGKDKSVTESIPLPNKTRVCNYIKRSPLVRSNTKVNVTNIQTGKIHIGTESRFCSRFRKW